MSQDQAIQIVQAMVAAFVAAAAVLLFCGRPWRRGVAVGAALGVGGGFWSGCLVLGPPPHWPPKEALDRLLLIVLPAVLAVEVAAAFIRRPRLLIGVLRVVAAAGAGRILLHNSVYITDSFGPGTATWTPGIAAAILAGLGAALATAWSLLVVLMTRSPGRTVPISLAVTCAGAGLVAMLSGYASGGMVTLTLAAALAG